MKNLFLKKGFVLLTIATFLVGGFFVFNTAQAATQGDVIINEFVPNETTEWVELLNTTNADISLTGWSLVDAANHIKSLSSLGTIAAYGIVVFEYDASVTGWLNNDADTITLLDNTNAPIHSVNYASAPASGQSASLGSDHTTWTNGTPTKGWFNGAPAPSIATIVASLPVDITTNLASLNPSAALGLYFEKTGFGKIEFTSSVNLTDQATVTTFQSLATNLELSQGHIKFSPETASALRTLGATLTMSGLTNASITAANILVNGVAGDPDDAFNDSSVSYNAGVLTFNANHFTTFDIDNTVYVDDDSVCGGKTPCYTTIQSAVSAVPVGGTINVYPGTYNEGNLSRDIYTGGAGAYNTGLLVYKNNLTIQGVDSSGSVITNRANVAATVIATERDVSLGDTIITGDNVTLSGLKFQLADLVVGCNKNVFATGENFTLKNSVVDNLVLGCSGLYISVENGGPVNSFTVQDNQFIKGEITVINGVGLTGGSISTRNITGNLIQDITDWGGVSLTGITGSSWTTQGIGAVTITGNTFSNNAYQIIARGASYENPVGYWTGFLANNTFDKAVLTKTPDNDARADSFARLGWVNDLTDPLNNVHFRAIGTNIQESITRATTGDTIKVGGGTYDEQVVIDGKNLTLQGAGDTTIIQPSVPATLTSTYTFPVGNFWANAVTASIVLVKNASAVTLKDFKVDGINVSSLPTTGSPSRLVGVLYGVSSGIVDNLTVNNIKTNSYADRAYAIQASGASTGTYNVEIKNSHVTDWARNGIVADGVNLTANVNNNILVGPGTISGQVANGILFIGGASGNATLNTISGMHYNASSSRTAGVLVYGSNTAGILIDQNNISDTDDGIDLSASSHDATVSNNNLHNNLEVGIQLEDGTANNTITDNTITGNIMAGIRFGGAGDPIPAEADTPPGAGNVAHSNTFSGNGKAVVNYDTGLNQIFDATLNYWGSAVPDFGSIITGAVTYDPYYVDSGMSQTNIDADLASAKASAPVSQGTYTNASWETLTLALALPETNNTEKVTKTNSINSAVSGLVLKTDQTITFDQPSSRVYGDANFDLTATASSTLPVSFASTTTTICTVSGSTVTIVKAGTCTITASQSGDLDYNAAPDVSRSISIDPRPITIAAVTNTKTYADGDRTATGVPILTLGTLASGDEGIYTEKYDTAEVGIGKILTPSAVIKKGSTIMNSSYQITLITNNTGIILALTQTMPDETTGAVTVDETTPEVVITDPDQNVAITVETSNATLDLTGLVSGGTGVLPEITINAGNATVVIPDNTTVTSAGWDGIMSAPTSGSSSGAAPAGFSVGNVVVEVGSPDRTLTFSNAVKIVLTGVTGTVGYKPAGSSTWQTITTQCNSATDSSNISSGECYFTDGGDTVIWTYHFTSFAGLNTVRSGGGGGGMINLSQTPTVSSVSVTPVAQVLGITTEQIPGCGDRTTGFSIVSGQSCATNSVGQVLGAEKFVFTKLMKRGSRGDEVKELQNFLIAAGYNPGVADGIFGVKVRTALIKFQLANKLTGDGIVGPKVRALLNK